LREFAVVADDVRAAGSQMVLADDTIGPARHAAEHGWIQPEALEAIHVRKQHDEKADKLDRSLDGGS
jgi:hypothetical protein